MGKFQYILFDWDGCLAKTLDLWLSTYKKVCEDRGIKLQHFTDQEIVEKSFGKWAQGLANLGVKDPEKAYEEAVNVVMKSYRTVDLYPGAKEILKKLRNGNKKIALHSSSYRSWIEKPLKYHLLNVYFDYIVPRDDVKRGKPDPEQILRIIHFFSAKKDECLVVGDSDLDIKASTNAKVSVALFYPKEHKKFYSFQELKKEKPEYVIKSLLDLERIVG